jgi:uncharacterized protein
MSADPDQKKPLIEYPAVYTFKVMGRQEHGFAEHVKRIFRRLMGHEIPEDSIRQLPSSKGTYLSVSVSVFLLSEEQRRTIYFELHRDPRVVYYL